LSKVRIDSKKRELLLFICGSRVKVVSVVRRAVKEQRMDVTIIPKLPVADRPRFLYC
jgi:hypothetical protein